MIGWNWTRCEACRGSGGWELSGMFRRSPEWLKCRWCEGAGAVRETEEKSVRGGDSDDV